MTTKYLQLKQIKLIEEESKAMDGKSPSNRLSKSTAYASSNQEEEKKEAAYKR